MTENQELNGFLRLVEKEQLRDKRFDIYVPILKEEVRGFDWHYVYHTAWAARVLNKIQPEKHIDIASSVEFVALVSAFIKIEHYDYCPVSLDIKGVECFQANIIKLPFSDNSISSLSCMHVVEHIGLGRYGALLDLKGDLKAISELKRVLAPQGNLLFVVPIGLPPRVLFNLHRIYSYDQIVSCFEDLKLVEFALIPDAGGLIEQADKEIADKQDYGCGCFWFRKE